MSEDQVDDIKGQVHELIRHIMKVEDYLIAPPEVQEATISGKRGIFGEPSHKELTIKLIFIEDSAFLVEKRRHLEELLASLTGDIASVRAEIERINGMEEK